MASASAGVTPSPASRISVIVPTLNEQDHLPATLRGVTLAPGDELIVVDGGSTDQTVAIAQQFTAQVLHSQRGRAVQMNCGAQHAHGDILLFLHADTLLPATGLEAVRCALQDGTVGGAFRLAILPPTPALRLVAWGTNLRARFGQLPYGDQALFMPRRIFEALGGYDEIPFMEDVRMVQALRQRGRLTILPQAVHTSGRRWQRDGVLYTTMRNTALITLYFWGVPPAKLQRWYGARRRGTREPGC
jgi:rSAM/selenodomain-associated transferase 2